MCFVFISNTWVKSITSISHNILDSGFQTVGLAPIKGGANIVDAEAHRCE